MPTKSVWAALVAVGKQVRNVSFGMDLTSAAYVRCKVFQSGMETSQTVSASLAVPNSPPFLAASSETPFFSYPDPVVYLSLSSLRGSAGSCEKKGRKNLWNARKPSETSLACSQRVNAQDRWARGACRHLLAGGFKSRCVCVCVCVCVLLGC